MKTCKDTATKEEMNKFMEEASKKSIVIPKLVSLRECT